MILEHNLEDKLKVSNEMIIAALMHFDNTHKNIEEALWEVNSVEREKGITNGINSAYLHTLKRALERMNSDYFKLLKEIRLLLQSSTKKMK